MHDTPEETAPAAALGSQEQVRTVRLVLPLTCLHPRCGGLDSSFLEQCMRRTAAVAMGRHEFTTAGGMIRSFQEGDHAGNAILGPGGRWVGRQEESLYAAAQESLSLPFRYVSHSAVLAKDCTRRELIPVYLAEYEYDKQRCGAVVEAAGPACSHLGPPPVAAPLPSRGRQALVLLTLSILALIGLPPSVLLAEMWQGVANPLTVWATTLSRIVPGAFVLVGGALVAWWLLSSIRIATTLATTRRGATRAKSPEDPPSEAVRASRARAWEAFVAQGGSLYTMGGRRHTPRLTPQQALPTPQPARLPSAARQGQGQGRARHGDEAAVDMVPSLSPGRSANGSPAKPRALPFPSTVELGSAAAPSERLSRAAVAGTNAPPAVSCGGSLGTEPASPGRSPKRRNRSPTSRTELQGADAKRTKRASPTKKRGRGA